MFIIAVDESGKTCNANELVSKKSAAEIASCRKHKFFCVACGDVKHPVSLKMRQADTIMKNVRNYTTMAWFSHHATGIDRQGGFSVGRESCLETARHWQAKHILTEHVELYWHVTSKCKSCNNCTSIENGLGAYDRVETTETTVDGTIYRFDAVLRRGDSNAICSVLEVWATHETPEAKRVYCWEMGYTFAEFDAQHVIETHANREEDTQTYKLDNLKIRFFECDDCEYDRKEIEMWKEANRQNVKAAEERSRERQLLKEQIEARGQTRAAKELAAELTITQRWHAEIKLVQRQKEHAYMLVRSKRDDKFRKRQ